MVTFEQWLASRGMPVPNRPLAPLGGSSDQLMTVRSGGYGNLPINPNIVQAYRATLSPPPIQGPPTPPEPVLPSPGLGMGGSLEPAYTGPVLGPMSGTYTGEALPTSGVMNSPADPANPAGISVRDTIGLVPGADAAINAGGYALGKFTEATDASRLYVEGVQAEGLYDYIKKYRGKMSDRELITTFKSPLNVLTANIPVGANDSDEDITAFIDGLIDAYENGYTAYGERTDVPFELGTGPTRVPVAQWGPGARAAHEYIAGQGNILERATGDIALDPTNWALGPARGAGGRLGKLGFDLVEGGRGAEGVGAAAKVASGRVLQGTGKVLAVPDIVLNEAADKAVGGVLGTATDTLKLIPGVRKGIGFLAETPTRVKALIAGEDSYDALKIARRMEGTKAGIADVVPPPETTPGGVPSGGPSPTTMADVPEVLGGPGANQARTALTPAERIAAIAEGKLNLFEPVEDARRLVDNAQAASRTGNPELDARWRAFDANNAPKRVNAWIADRDLEAQIKSIQGDANALKAERDALPAFTPEREAVQTQIDELYGSTEPLKVDQKINAVEHTIYDVADDYKNAFGDLPDIEPTAKRIDLSRPRVGDEVLVGGERTPNGNRITVGADAQGNRKYTILGGGETKAYVTKGADGKWIVKTKKHIIGEGLSDAEAIQLIDDTLPPAGSALTDESTSYLIERAVYQSDAAAMRVVRQRVTPEQYERIRAAQQAYKDIRASTPKPLTAPEAISEPISAPPPGDATVIPAPTEPEVPAVVLPPDVARTIDQTPFTGAAEPIYANKTLRQVRDEIETGVLDDQARAQQLLEEIAAEKAALGLSDKPLLRPGESKTKAMKRPTVERAREGPMPKGRKSQAPLSTRDIIAKEQQVADLLAKYSRYGDVLAGDAGDIADQAAAYARRADLHPELKKRPPVALDLLDAVVNRLPRHLLLADPLTSWAYSGRNILGNIETAALGTQGKSLDRIIESFHTAASKKKPLAQLITEDLGLADIPRQYTKESATAIDMVERGLDTPTRELGKKLRLDWAARPFDKKRAFDAAVEYGFKVESAYSPVLQGAITENMAALADELAGYAARRKIALSDDDFMTLFMGLRKAETGVFSYDDVADGVFRLATERGVDADAARRLSRTASNSWKVSSRQAQLDAIRETNRIFPSQRRMTNFDTYFKYLSLFHFWPTRTARLVLEEMIRNPQLYHIWQETHRGLGRMAEEGGYPTSVKMLMRIGESPFGFMLYANPVSLFLVTALNPDTNGVPDPKGMTRLGHDLKRLRESTGIGVTPFIDAVLNVTGVYGNAFPPNPWPSRTTELAGAAIDYALIEMGHTPGTPVYDNAMAWIRSQGSGIIPGTSNVPMTDQGAYTEDIVGSVVLDNDPALANRMAQVNPDGTPTQDALAAQDEFAAIMEDDDDPAHVAALRQAAMQNLFTRAINVVSPITIKAKIESREQTLDLAHAGYDTEHPTEVQEGAGNIRGAVTQTPTANALDAQLGQYNQIGTPRQQQIANGWRMIAFADFDAASRIQVGGRLYDKTELEAMDQETRFDLADAWVAEIGGTGEYEDYKGERDAFVEANPELAGYQAYKDEIGDYPLGSASWIAVTREGNPNYDRYITEQMAKWDESAEDAAFSPGAYLAYKGIQAGLYEPTPISVRDTSDVPFSASETVGGASTGSSGGSGSSDRLTYLSEQDAKYQAEMDIFRQYLPVGVEWEQMAPDQRRTYAEQLRKQGVNIPTMPGVVESYYNWKALQSATADTSYEAYLAWVDSYQTKVNAAA